MSTQRIHSEGNCYLLKKKNVTAIVGFTLFFTLCEVHWKRELKSWKPFRFFIGAMNWPNSQNEPFKILCTGHMRCNN